MFFISLLIKLSFVQVPRCVKILMIFPAAKGSKDSNKRKSTASGDNASEERERKKKRKESKDESEVPTSSLPVSDITDRIKQELISEFSKDANIVTQVPSEVPKNKRPLDSAPKETESSIQPAKASEVPPEKVSEGQCLETHFFYCFNGKRRKNPDISNMITYC